MIEHTILYDPSKPRCWTQDWWTLGILVFELMSLEHNQRTGRRMEEMDLAKPRIYENDEHDENNDDDDDDDEDEDEDDDDDDDDHDDCKCGATSGLGRRCFNWHTWQ